MKILKQSFLFLVTCAVAFCFFIFWVFSIPDGEAYPAVALGELYSYSADGDVKETLNLAPKIIIQFVQPLPPPEKQQDFLLQSLSGSPPHEYEQEVLWNAPTHRWFVSFEENAPAVTMIDAVNLINKSEIARAELVFLVHGIEAEMTAMIVEPKEFFSVPDLQEQVFNELKKYGEFSIGSFMVQDDGSFLISFSDIKPPLSLLRLINLAATDTWVRRAYPRFRYLHPPVVTELKVTPETGQLDEIRTVSLTIRNFDPERIKIDPQLVSPLGSAEFIPKPVRGDKARYFEVSSKPEVSTTRDMRAEIVTLVWKLHLFEVQATGTDMIGKWVLPGPPLTFMENGELRSAKIDSAEFFVISHLGGVVTSFPPVKPLTLPEIHLTPLPTLPFKPSPSWLDSVPFKPTILLYTSLILAGIFGIATLLQVKTLLRSEKKSASYEPSLKPWTELCIDLLNKAQRHSSIESYQKVYEALFLVLKNTFPGKLNPHPQLHEVIEACDGNLGEKENHLLKTIFAELEKVYTPNFEPQGEVLTKVILDVRALITSLERLKTMS